MSGAAQPAAQQSGPTDRDFQNDGVELNSRYAILPTFPLQALNTVNGNAFAARHVRDRKTDTFAYVLPGLLPPRFDVMGAVKAVESQAQMHIADWGVIDWPPERAKRFCIVAERPNGRRLLRTMSDTREPMTEDQIVRTVLGPMAGALRELASRGVVHGAVRPTNMFYRDLAGGSIMLGECVCAPAHFGQSPLFLTIERGMAQPGGRGLGNAGDDLYALGVSILVLLLGRNPARGDDEAVMNAKIDRGSYPALAGDVRVPLNLIEPLRGLLIDDPKQRWSLEELELWLSGRRLSPKQPQVPRRAVRPIEFGGSELWHARALARAFARNSKAAAAIVETGELDKWLRRSLGDEARADAAATAVDTASVGKGGSLEDRLVARVCIALDPVAPIRYRDLAVMPDGVGPLMGELAAAERGLQPVAELIAAQLPMFWINNLPDAKLELIPLVETFEQLRTFLERGQYGYGIERCLYDLNPAMACLSPIVSRYYPNGPKELLEALEIVAAEKDRPKAPMDRHIAAFLMTRVRRMNDRLMPLLAPTAEPSRMALALLTVLADVQRKHGPIALPQLSGWMVELLGPVVEQFRNRRTRETVRRDLRRAADTGNLAALQALVDDAKATARDTQGFEAAQRQFDMHEREIATLEHEIANRNELVGSLGKQAAAAISGLFGTLILIGYVLFRML